MSPCRGAMDTRRRGYDEEKVWKSVVSLQFFICPCGAMDTRLRGYDEERKSGYDDEA